MGFGFAVALIAPALGTSLATVERPALPAEVVLSFALMGLATQSLLSGYRKGGLTGSFLGIAWICCLWFVLNGGPTPQQRPLLPDATENFRLVVTWGKGNWDDEKQGGTGALRHMRTKPRRVVAEASPYFEFGGSYSQWWPAIVPADAPARVDGLGDVEFVPVAERFIRTRQIGPLDSARFGLSHTSARGLETRTTRFGLTTSGRLRFRRDTGAVGPTWSMRSLENPRRVEIRTLEPNAKGATFDPATNRLKPINAMPVFPSALWPIGTGVRVMVIANEPKSECVLRAKPSSERALSATSTCQLTCLQIGDRGPTRSDALRQRIQVDREEVLHVRPQDPLRPASRRPGSPRSTRRSWSLGQNCSGPLRQADGLPP